MFTSLCAGQFYAPEQPGERVLSLSSNQSENTLMVCGDTSGRLQVWSIGHFGLDIQHQVCRSLYCSMYGRHLPFNTQGDLCLHSLYVSSLLCCSPGRFKGESWSMWRFSTSLAGCGSSQLQLMAPLRCGRRTATTWGVSGGRSCGTSLSLPITRSRVYAVK